MKSTETSKHKHFLQVRRDLNNHHHCSRRKRQVLFVFKVYLSHLNKVRSCWLIKTERQGAWLITFHSCLTLRLRKIKLRQWTTYTLPVGTTLKLTLHVTTVTQVLIEPFHFHPPPQIWCALVATLGETQTHSLRKDTLRGTPWFAQSKGPIEIENLKLCPKLMPSKVTYQILTSTLLWPMDFDVFGISFYWSQTRRTEFQFDSCIISWGRLWTLNIVASRGNMIVSHRRIMCPDCVDLSQTM